MQNTASGSDDAGLRLHCTPRPLLHVRARYLGLSIFVGVNLLRNEAKDPSPRPLSQRQLAASSSLFLFLPSTRMADAAPEFNVVIARAMCGPNCPHPSATYRIDCISCGFGIGLRSSDPQVQWLNYVARAGPLGSSRWFVITKKKCARRVSPRLAAPCK